MFILKNIKFFKLFYLWEKNLAVCMNIIVGDNYSSFILR